jgi:hypothetical protein
MGPSKVMLDDGEHSGGVMRDGRFVMCANLMHKLIFLTLPTCPDQTSPLEHTYCQFHLMIIRLTRYACPTLVHVVPCRRFYSFA